MGFLNLSKKGIAIALSAQMVLATQAVTMAQAEMLGTDAAISKYTALANRNALMDEMQRDEVRAEIEAGCSAGVRWMRPGPRAGTSAAFGEVGARTWGSAASS